MWWDDIKNLTVSHIKSTACNDKRLLKSLTFPESTGFPAAFLNLFALSLFGPPPLSETDAEEDAPLLVPLLAGDAGPAAPRLPPD